MVNQHMKSHSASGGQEGNVSLKSQWDSDTLPLEWVKLKNADSTEYWLRTPNLPTNLHSNIANKVQISIMTLETSLPMSSNDIYTNMTQPFCSWCTPRKEHLCALRDMNMDAYSISSSQKWKENFHQQKLDKLWYICKISNL